MDLEVIAVAFAADNIVAKGLAAAARSAADRIEEAGRQAEFYVVDCGLSRRSKKRIELSLESTSATISWLSADRRNGGTLLRQLSTRSTRPYPPSAYARLLLPGLLPGHVDRVVYLDADVVVHDDPSWLWDEPMGDDVLFAVADLPHDNGNAGRIARTVDQIRYPYAPSTVYFQSGVLVIDIAKFRQEDLAAKAFEFLATYPQMQFPDQDALNVLLATRTRLVDPRWNQMAAVYRYDSDNRDGPFDPTTLLRLQTEPFIIHYSGRPKPWEPECQHPLLHEWFAAIDRTVWNGWRPNRLNGVLDRLPRAPRVVQKRLSRLYLSMRRPVGTLPRLGVVADPEIDEQGVA